jgi:hypothetical protein
MITGKFVAPREYALDLTCDAKGCRRSTMFVDVNYTSAVAAARASGWKLRLSGCLCKACGGKK